MRHFAVVAVAVAALVPSTASAQFSRMHLDSTSGRVGYHLSVGFPLTSKDDLPRGNTGGAVSGSCGQWTVPQNYQGELPPGVAFVNQGDVLFSGTPRQPGTWRGSLQLEVYCSGGPDTNRYQRFIPVTWQIDP